jgi:hypothetical protein
MEKSPAMHSPDPFEAADAGAVIAELRHHVRVWIDGDRVLPADGSSLLATLDQALVELIHGDNRGVRAGIQTFVGRVQALIAAQALEASDGHPPIEAAARLIARLASAGGTDG